MTKSLLTLDHAAAAKVLKDLGLHPINDFFFEPPDSRTEFLLHDVGHALSLGIGIGGYFDAKIEERLTRVAPLRSDLRNEACVLAAEWIFYGYTSTRLTIGDVVRDGTLRSVAFTQQVPQAWLDRARKSRRALVLAEQIARWSLEQGVLVKTGCATDLAFTDLRRRIRETPKWPRGRA